MTRQFLIAAALLGGCSVVDALGEGEGAGASDSGPDAGEELCEAGESTHTAEATYDSTILGGGNCTYGPSPDILVGGVSPSEYDGAIGCGGCLHVERPGVGSVVVRVVDSCVDCPEDEIVLSEEAFAMLADVEVGVTEVMWRWVECTVDGPLDLRFKEDSDQQWLAIQVRNHRHRIGLVEAQVSGASSWLALERADYNYFIADAGLGAGPFDFRITDVYGHAVEETEMALGSGVVRTGTEQLPSCE